MQHRQETSLIRVVQAILTAGTGTTAISGVDCANGSRVRWLIPITTTLDTGTIAVTHQHSDTDSGYAATTATVTLTDAGGGQYDGMCIVFEVAKPVKRWNKLSIVRGTANSALGAIICEIHAAPSEPTSLNTTKVASATKWNSPPTA